MTDEELARALLAARGGAPVAGGAARDRLVADAAQAYRVQALVMARLGEIGGWKVGAPAPDGPISCAPLPASEVHASPCVLDSARFTQREVESEICFRLGRDLPPRAEAYGRDEIIGAIGTCHAGIEVLQSRWAAPDAVGALALLADSIQAGAYVVGAPIAHWRVILERPCAVRQVIEGGGTLTATQNPGGDMVRMIAWLADTGAVWAGGLRRGQVVTCGSWTGKTRVGAGRGVTTTFEGAPPVELRFAAD